VPWDGDLDSFFGSIEPLRLCTETPPFGQQFNIHIFTHDKRWISGSSQITNLAQAGFDAVFPRGSIKEGTSGAPVFNDAGEVLGVVSRTVKGRRGRIECNVFPCLPMVLPRWLLTEFDEQRIEHFRDFLAAGARELLERCGLGGH
jgi:hypothetical protein